MTEEQQYTLIDKRDEKTYTIAKLKDGNIWMTQNLDLDIDSTKTYTNKDTDLGWNASTHSYDTASWTPVRSTYLAEDASWCIGGTWNSQYGHCSGNFTPESYDPGDLYWNGELYVDSSQVSDSGIPQYYLGNYYNWNAAVAVNDGSGYFTEEYHDINMSRSYYDMDQSICPAGWTLPKAGNESGSGSFQYLYKQYGWTESSYQFSGDYKPYQSPLYFNYSSNYSGDSSYTRSYIGYGGYYLTSVAMLDIWNSNAYTYTAVAESLGANGYGSPNQGGANISNGWSVRCIAR